jgi:hypothetical protein
MVEVSVQHPGDSTLSYLKTVRCQPQGHQHHGIISLQVSTLLSLLCNLHLHRTEPVLWRHQHCRVRVIEPVSDLLTFREVRTTVAGRHKHQTQVLVLVWQPYLTQQVSSMFADKLPVICLHVSGLSMQCRVLWAAAAFS